MHAARERGGCSAHERQSIQNRCGDIPNRHQHKPAPAGRAHRSVRQRQHEHLLHARSYQLWREHISDAATRQRVNTRRRWILAIAAASVLVAAMDTYVVVLALPAIMAQVGIGIDQLQAATPIVSGFLLGYIVVMPLLGRLSDLYGRRPLLLLCLAVFAGGSLVTASATDLGSLVTGGALQGLGG